MPERCFRPPSKRGRPARAPAPGVHHMVKILPQACDSFGPPTTTPSSSSLSSASPVAAAAAAATAPPTPSLLGLTPLDQAPTAPTQDLRQQQLHSGRHVNTNTTASAPPPENQGLSGVTTTFLVETIIALKEDMRAMTDKVQAMKKKVRGVEQLQGDVQEMQRRLQQLEGDNSQLRAQLAQVAASRHGVARYSYLASSSSSSSSSSTCSSSSSCSFADGGSPKRRRVSHVDDDGGGDGATGSNDVRPEAGGGLSAEMLCCFPFLQRYNLSPSRFVVDDLQKAIAVITVQSGKKSSTTFATHQFCNITGFSMAELLGGDVFSLIPRHQKLEFIRSWHEGSRAGMGDVLQCCVHLEHKGEHLIKVAARNQFFFSSDGQLTYAVMCVDEVLGRDYLPFSIEELRVREKAEWDEVGREFAEATMQASALAVRGCHHVDPSALSPFTPPYTPTTGAEGAWHEFLLFEDNDSTCSSSSSSSFSSSPPPLFPPSSNC